MQNVNLIISCLKWVQCNSVFAKVFLINNADSPATSLSNIFLKEKKQSEVHNKSTNSVLKLNSNFLLAKRLFNATLCKSKKSLDKSNQSKKWPKQATKNKEINTKVVKENERKL